jgi:peptide/nickel transport system permease protein
VNRPLKAGLAIVGLLGLAALTAPALTSAGLVASPTATAIDRKFEAPGPGHWLGRDDLGRDVLSRLVHGARPSLTVAIVATLTALAVGVPFGSLAGLRGGPWDLLLTRLMELTASLPSLPLVLLVTSMTMGGEGGGGWGALLLLAVVIGLTRWAGIARHVRGGIQRTRVEDYVAVSLTLGSGTGRVLVRHLLPAAAGPALVAAAFGAGSAVLLEAALSYLGLGAQPPLPSWGRMVASAALEPGAWWLLTAPGAAIALLVLGLNLVAEGIRLRAAPPES